MQASIAQPISPADSFQSANWARDFRFSLARPEDNAALLEFSAKADMPGAIRAI